MNVKNSFNFNSMEFDFNFIIFESSGFRLPEKKERNSE